MLIKHTTFRRCVKDISFAISDDGVHDEYLCPITREVMRDPVMAAGNTRQITLRHKFILFLG
jgi:hypothetical protein